MRTSIEKIPENRSRAVTDRSSKNQNVDSATFQFKDNRPKTVKQRKLQAMMNRPAPGFPNPIQRKGNNTGLPDNLKTGIEHLSGHAMDDVKVHYNSSKPAQLQAHAYAQGTNIHIAPGQEKHLPHEAWHVVQQKQGRVRPTLQMKGKVSINDDIGLEKEADVMGAKALTFPSSFQLKRFGEIYPRSESSVSLSLNVAQRTVKEANPANTGWEPNDIGGVASQPEIQNKKNDPHVLIGKPPGKASPLGWSDVLSKAAKVKGHWVRFHCINEKVGGPGINTNLVPTTHAINTGATWKGFETDLKSHFDKNEWIWAKTQVIYDASYPPGFPRRITGYAQYYDSGTNSWKYTARNGTSIDLSPPSFGGGVKTRTLDEMTATTWSLVTGLEPGTQLVKHLNSLSSSCSNIDDFNAALYEPNVPSISSAIQKNIDAAIKHTHPKVHIAVDY